MCCIKQTGIGLSKIPETHILARVYKTLNAIFHSLRSVTTCCYWHMKFAHLVKTLHPNETPRRQVGGLLMHSLDTHSQQGGATQALHRRNSSLLKWPRISHPRLELGRWRRVVREVVVADVELWHLTFMLWLIVRLCSNVSNVQYQSVICKIFIRFGSFPFWGERAQVQRLQLLKWLFFVLVHQVINYTCTEFNPCLPNCNVICGLWTTVECKV